MAHVKNVSATQNVNVWIDGAGIGILPGKTFYVNSPNHSQWVFEGPGNSPGSYWSGTLWAEDWVTANPDTGQVLVNHPEIVRPNQRNLTTEQQTKFINALNTLNANGGFGPLVAIHGDMSHDMHGSEGSFGAQRFLPWHRIYLYHFERALRAIDPTVALPYWDWTVDRGIPPWIANFKPSVVVPGMSNNPLQVVRNPGDPLKLPSPANIADVMNNVTYTMFTSVSPVVEFGGGLEGIHNGVHNWFPNSSMNVLATAPADPIFWLHHANIDRIWANWQELHMHADVLIDLLPVLYPNTADDAGQPADQMDPWPGFTEVTTRRTLALGYAYGT